MNIKGNQRSRETKNKINGTFYHHYEDVNALLNEMGRIIDKGYHPDTDMIIFFGGGVNTIARAQFRKLQSNKSLTLN